MVMKLLSRGMGLFMATLVTMLVFSMFVHM
jgi:hypothetical protein